MNEARVAVLRQSPVFQGVDETVLAILLAQAKVEEVFAGQVLWREGDPGDELIVVLEGAVRITRRDDEGHEIVLSEVKPGGILGEMALLDPGPRSATVTCMADTAYLTLSHDALDDLLWEQGAVGAAVLLGLCRVLGERVRKTDTSVRDLLHQAVLAGSAEDAAARDVWRLLWTGSV